MGLQVWANTSDLSSQSGCLVLFGKKLLEEDILGFPITSGTFLGVHIIRILLFGALYRGPLILGSYHMGQSETPRPRTFKLERHTQTADMVVSITKGDPNIDPKILYSLLWGRLKRYPQFWETPIYGIPAYLSCTLLSPEAYCK